LIHSVISHKPKTMPRKTSARYSLNDSLGHLASNASRAVLKRINQELSRQGYPITSEQFSVLVHVWDQNGQPQYALTSALFKDKTTMARLVGGLESMGLIFRTPGRTDAREKNVFLTEPGREMMAKIGDVVLEILEQAQKGIDAKDLQTCKDVLRRFHKNLLSSTV
jgi:DNA-binding MarR family transcriptional regulator